VLAHLRKLYHSCACTSDVDMKALAAAGEEDDYDRGEGGAGGGEGGRRRPSQQAAALGFGDMALATEHKPKVRSRAWALKCVVQVGAPEPSRRCCCGRVSDKTRVISVSDKTRVISVSDKTRVISVSDKTRVSFS
jgi:hypothetical protein